VRAHQPADLLAVDDETLVAELGADAPVAVGLELVADRVILASTSASSASTAGAS
jgi:hypothetical protein